MAESKEHVKRALADLGWKLQTQDERPDAVMANHGKYHLMISFDDGEPTSVIVSYVGRGGAILSAKWAGVEHLPTPKSVVRVLSKDA